MVVNPLDYRKLTGKVKERSFLSARTEKSELPTGGSDFSALDDIVTLKGESIWPNIPISRFSRKLGIFG